MKEQIKIYFAEFIGTLALTLAVTFSLNTPNFPIPTPAVAALTLGLFVYTVGSISGCHINPAVTIGLWVNKKIVSREAILYIVAQALGAFVALNIGRTFIISPTALAVADTYRVFFAEAIGTFFFAFGIAAVVAGAVHERLSGLVVGGSLLLGISIASIGANGVLNPAVAYGIKSFSTAYVVGPIIGSILGMSTSFYLNKKGK